MRTLFRSAFAQGHRLLIAFTLIAMCLVTFANQLEIFALGVITQKGPDFFELFAPVKEGKIVTTDSLTFEQVEEKWRVIASAPDAPITKADANQYITTVKKNDFIGKMLAAVDNWIPVSKNLMALAGFIAIVALFKAITLFTHRFLTRLVAIRVSRDLRQQFFEHIQAQPMSFYQQYNIGTLSSRVMSDSAMIAEAVNACLVNYFSTPFTVITTLVICFLTSWRLTLVIFVGFPLILIPIFLLARRVKRISKQIQQNQERFASVLLDFISGIQTVKVFAMEQFSLRKYKELNSQMAHLEQRGARYDVSTRPIVHTIGMFFLATALVYGLYVLQMSVSEVLFYCGLLYVFYEPIKKFAEENSHIQRGIAAAERMQEVMSLRPQIQDEPGSIPLQKFEKDIEFKDVWFKYGDDWVLKGVSFKVNKGETVALVGPTGSGKSTIVQLLPRLYEPQKGEILIDGKSINKFTQHSLREQIAFVPQKPFLFLDSVASNIAFGRSFSREEVQQAAIRAYADEFITLLPQGYETELNVGGSNLSGGQQQRLAIARALVKKAPILVLDEATSSLDNISEARIKSAMRELKGQVTQIVIAHRLTTIEDADRIIYLEHGVKVAEGTLEQLLQICPGFKRMWDHTHQKISV